MPADDTNTPTTDTPATEKPTTANATAKPRRARTPRAKAAETPKPEVKTEPTKEPPAQPAKPKRTPAKPATRRAPARSSASRSTSRTAAPRTTARSRADNGNESNWQALAPLAGAAGVGIALGLLAAFGRKAAVQAPTAFAEDWATALAAEHKAALALFDRLESTEPGAAARRIALLAQLKQLLARHALQEESVVYPALRQKGWASEADDLAARAALVKSWLYELANSPAGSAGWMATLRTFRTGFEEQAGIEDNKLFPALRGELTPEENKALASAMNKEGFKLA